MELLQLPDRIGLSLLQTVLAFVAILLLTKLIGKQQVGQLTLYDYVNGITIGSIAATVATDEAEKFLGHVLDLVLFAGLTFGLSVATVKSRGLRRVIQGTPTVVVHDGQIVERNLLRNRYSVDDLKQKLRAKDVFDLAEIQAAVLEPNGGVNVLLKPEHRPVTRSDLHVATPAERLPVDVIVEGRVFRDNLRRLGKDEDWLRSELRARGYGSPGEIFYAAFDPKGRLYVDPRGEDPRESARLIDP